MKPGALARSSFLRYSLIGAVGLAADMALLALFTATGVAEPLVARLGSLLGALTLTWWLHRGFTFGVAAPDRFPEWCRYLATNAVGAALNYLTYTVLVLTAPAIGIYGALLCGSVLAWIANYWGARNIVFRVH
ncbi:MAG: GtrA family protein [Alphaproteobacteria bacterium]